MDSGRGRLDESNESKVLYFSNAAKKKVACLLRRLQCNSRRSTEFIPSISTQAVTPKDLCVLWNSAAIERRAAPFLTVNYHVVSTSTVVAEGDQLFSSDTCTAGQALRNSDSHILKVMTPHVLCLDGFREP